jgi:hypothetical protein
MSHVKLEINGLSPFKGQTPKKFCRICVHIFGRIRKSGTAFGL